MLGRLKEMNINSDGTQDLTITVHSDIREMFDELSDNDIDIEIKKHRKGRSLDANAKCWVMIDKLAEKLRMTKTEVYKHAIHELGGVSDIICVKANAAETLCSIWERRGLGWMTKVEPSKLPGCVNVTLWYGSSCYDTKQMADLINNLVQMCNEQGIPTLSDDEAYKLIEAWGRKVEKND